LCGVCVVCLCVAAASESSERRYADEPDSQVVKYAFPLEQAAQDLLFSLAEVCYPLFVLIFFFLSLIMFVFIYIYYTK
jgi:Ca2+/Na+ antiporter